MSSPKSISPPNSSKSGYQSRTAKKSANAKSSALNTAMSWLAEWLADGPRPSLETIERAAAAGIAEKTLRRAAKALGIETAQSGAQWFWMLPLQCARPDGQVGQMAKPDGQALPPTPPAVPRPDQPRAGDEVGQIIELLARLTARVDALETAIRPAPKSAPVPTPKPPRILPDLRQRATQPGRWGVQGLVRCLECRHADRLIDTRGHCERAGIQVTWPYARRSCGAFEAEEGE